MKEEKIPERPPESPYPRPEPPQLRYEASGPDIGNLLFIITIFLTILITTILFSTKNNHTLKIFPDNPIISP